MDRSRLSMESFEKFSSILVLDNRRLCVLEDFQKVILKPIIEGYTENTVLIPKKQGKTTIIGAMALFYLFAVADCEIACAAASREQAGLLYTAAASFIARTPALKKHYTVLPGFKEIRSNSGLGRLKVMASDSATADGWLGDLAICDELGRWKSQEMYSIFRAGVGPREGQVVVITTAADDELSPLGEMRTKAHELPVHIDEGRYHYRSDGKNIAFHEWALDDDDDRDDMAVVKLANPASWNSVDTLQALHDSPGMPAWFWARLHCGVWLQGENSAIEPRDWDCLDTHKEATAGTALVQVSGASTDDPIPRGAKVWLGLDLGWKQDATAIVPCWYHSDVRRVFGPPVILEPPGGGEMLDDRKVIDALIAFHERYNVQGVVYDPAAGGQQLAQQLGRYPHNMKFIEHSQKSTTLAVSDVRFMEALRRKELRHNGDRVFRQHVLNAVERQLPSGGFYFDRPKSGPRKATDALRAASMAHHVALAENERKPSALYGF